MKLKLESRLLGKISINLRYTDDMTLMAESEEELKSFLMVKEESAKASLKLSIQNTKFMAFSREGNGNTPVLLPGKSHGQRSLGRRTPAVHGVSKSWTRMSDFTFPFHFHALEKEMATHSSVLAWRIPWTAVYGSAQGWT